MALVLMRSVLPQAFEERGFKLFRYLKLDDVMICALVRTARSLGLDFGFRLKRYPEILI